MSLSGKLFALFPVFHLGLIISSFLLMFKINPVIGFSILISSIYLVPLICFRILNLLFPMQEGISDILQKGLNSWWAGHQIQLLFITIPAFEGILKMVPGLYSFWLRRWGSKVGRNVYWTPGVINYDRNLLNIGDNVIFGEKAITVSHVITPKNGQALLMVKTITIEKGAFVGAASVIGPGATLKEKAFVKADGRVYQNEVIDNGKR